MPKRPAAQFNDREYVTLVLGPLEVCKRYRPKFGHGKGLSLTEFKTLYSTDPFYSWFGLNSPLLYTAHRAAGGMTSVYRQIGFGCQRLFQRIVMDKFSTTIKQATWSYQIVKRGKRSTLSLDCKIDVSDIPLIVRPKFKEWLTKACLEADVSKEISNVLKGAVFEIRQGYKSKDAKRQNADIVNAVKAYSRGYLPVLVLLSTQIDDDIAERYKSAGWLILRGTVRGSPLDSTYEFCRRILGYDLAGFFQRNSNIFKSEMEAILRTLLRG